MSSSTKAAWLVFRTVRGASYPPTPTISESTVKGHLSSADQFQTVRDALTRSIAADVSQSFTSSKQIRCPTQNVFRCAQQGLKGKEGDANV